MRNAPPPVARSRRPWILGALAVVVLGLLAGAAVTVLGGPAPELRPTAACCTPPSTESPYVGGPLVNDGRFAVRVTAIAGPEGTETLVAPAGAPGTAEEARPFAPFELAPGGSRDVFIRAEAPGCPPEAVGTTGARGSSSVRIEYERLWLDRSTVVEADAAGTLFFAERPEGPCAYLAPPGGG